MLCTFFSFFCENKFLREAFLCSAFPLALSGWMFCIPGEHWWILLLSIALWIDVIHSWFANPVCLVCLYAGNFFCACAHFDPNRAPN